ncbi:CARDB domain-containing protein [Hymenobacter swuensis]|uniref:CARDB domain-containing protein n=1 Tax=Hymenobacter swuensis TaxID=1446467 RepID=UPI0018CC40D5|nr:CARDB domain-containing protein [Hymenobacter swuensis]
MSCLSVSAQGQNQPDLVVVAPFDTPTSVLAGGTAYMAANIKNQGTNGSQFNCIGYYLSGDATWDATDTFLGTTCQSLLFPGQSGTCAVTARFPLVPDGSYRLVLVADPLNAERESDETNNVVSFPLTITTGTVALPDLELWRPSLSFSALPAGGSTGVFSFIYNRGPVGAAAHEIGFYLSVDTVFSAASDVLLGTVTNSSLGGVTGGGTGVGSIFSAPVLTVPLTTAPGNYYLVVMIDPRNMVIESNENNNSRALALRVTGSVTATGLAASATGIEVQPNPVERGAPILVKLSNPRATQPLTAMLTDALGRPVTGTSIVMGGTWARIETTQMPSGLYLLHVGGAGQQMVRRIVVQ